MAKQRSSKYCNSTTGASSQNAGSVSCDDKDHHDERMFLRCIVPLRRNQHKGRIFMLAIPLISIVFVLASASNLLTTFTRGVSQRTDGDTISIIGKKRDERNSLTSSNCHWRPEPLYGVCDVTKSTDESKQYKTAEECEQGCCESQSCVTFQYRTKEGCLFGKDTRLGGEKDGVSGWCEPRPPAQWQGQRIKRKATKEAVEGACQDDSWNPNELNGQCFGLGGRKKIVVINTAQACRDSCCASPDCSIWQWRFDAGCFYSSRGFNCQEANDLDLEPFVGKRKVQPTRTYKPDAYSGDFADMATARQT